MSKITERARITLRDVAAAREAGRKIVTVTCYDSSFARLVSKTDIDIVLVGDSLGNVMLGYDNTIPVTMDDMVHHTAAVSRVLTKPLLVSDLPFLSYNVSVEQALANAGRLMQQGGAAAVKLEGGRPVTPQVRAIVAAGIPVMGHLGLTPQSLHAMSGHRVQGRGAEASQRLIDDAIALAEAGAFSVVLEMVPMSLAAKVTEALAPYGVATIGIGAGPHCSGQVLVMHDLLGFDDEFQPKFLKRYAALGQEITAALNAYAGEVRGGVYPTEAHAFKD